MGAYSNEYDIVHNLVNLINNAVMSNLSLIKLYDSFNLIKNDK